MLQFWGASTGTSNLSHCQFELLERRELFAIARPDHIVIVIEQDRASDAIGNPIWDYLNELAATGLVYTNSHGVTHPSEPNSLALYSGSTHGITDNGRHHSFSGPNLAKALFDAGLSFSGFIESLPTDGSQAAEAGDGIYPDLYTRNLNAMAQFTDLGIDPLTGQPRPNAKVNRTFGAFTSIPTGDYSNLPTVSFIIPNNLHSAHGSNAMEPWAGSADEENNDILRNSADNWLEQNLDAYLQWARQNNSLLIVTQDEERWTGGSAQTVTTVVNGDADLFNPGTNSDYVKHYNLLRTITDMYGIAPLGETGAVAALDADASGQLSPDVQALQQVATSTSLVSSASTSAFGQAVTFTAMVTPASGSVAPGGLVTFMDGPTTLGTAALNAAGIATFTTSSLSVASHSITAVYSGSASFTASASPSLAQTVNKAATNTTLTSSLGSSVFGQGLTFTANVNATTPGAGAPGGTITFMDGATVLATVAVNGAGQASYSTSSLAVGSHAISAVYSGGANFNVSTSASLTHVVSAGALANNNFASRQPLSGAVVIATGTNVGATKETFEPRHAGNAGGKSIWFTWTAPESGKVTIDTQGSSFNTTLGVYTGTAVWFLSSVASNNDAGSGLQTSKVTFNAVAGRIYQIAVDGFNGAAGNVVLRIHAHAKAPTGVAASDGTFADKVRVTWSAATGAAAYEVWRSTTSSSSRATKISVADVVDTTFDDTTALAGKTYWYFVKAKNAVSTSGFNTANAGVRATAPTTALFSSNLIAGQTSRIDPDSLLSSPI